MSSIIKERHQQRHTNQERRRQSSFLIWYVKVATMMNLIMVILQAIMTHCQPIIILITMMHWILTSRVKISGSHYKREIV